MPSLVKVSVQLNWPVMDPIIYSSTLITQKTLRVPEVMCPGPGQKVHCKSVVVPLSSQKGCELWTA